MEEVARELAAGLEKESDNGSRLRVFYRFLEVARTSQDGRGSGGCSIVFIESISSIVFLNSVEVKSNDKVTKMENVKRLWKLEVSVNDRKILYF